MLLFPPACTTVAPGKYVARHPSCDSRLQKSASSLQEETFVHAAGLFEGAPAHQHTRPGDPVDVEWLLTGIESGQIQPRSGLRGNLRVSQELRPAMTVVRPGTGTPILARSRRR